MIRSPSVAGRLVLVQPTTTYQAYNLWGGYDLYQGPRRHEALRARMVSFDRPYDREDGAADFFAEEQPLLAYAERLGLPLAYLSSVDLDLDPRVLDGARAVISEAHGEYWSPRMRRSSPAPGTGARTWPFSAPTRSTAGSGWVPRRSARTGSRSTTATRARIRCTAPTTRR